MATVFLVLFLVGFGLTVTSAVLGAVEAGSGHIHIGHVDGGAHADLGGHVGHAHAGHVHAGHGDNPNVYGDTAAVSPVNFQTVVAFITGFGGVGYIGTRLGWALYLIAVPLAIVGGLLVSTLIFKFMLLLKRGETPMAPTDYEHLIGSLSAGIREGGTGEMLYLQNGSRQTAIARSHDGRAIAAGTEVIVLRYENGVVYVQPWQEFQDQN